MKKALILGEKENLELISETLKKIGFTVIEITTIKQLNKSILTIKPQVIVSPTGTNMKRITADYPFVPIVYYDTPVNETNLKNEIDYVTKKYLSDDIFWNEQFLIIKEKKKEKRKKTLLFYLSLIVILIGFIIFTNIYIKKEIMLKFDIKSFNLPYQNPCSFAVLNESILICSRYTSSIYEHEIQDLKIKKVYTFPEGRFNSIVLADKNLYSCDPWNKSIYKHKTSGEFNIVRTYNLPVESVGSISYDGKFFWMLNISTGEIYKVALGDEFRIIAKYNLLSSDEKFVNITSDGKFLYGLTQKTNLIYRYKLPELKLDKIFSLPKIDDEFVSFIITKKYIWLCNEKKSKVYRCSKKLLK